MYLGEFNSRIINIQYQQSGILCEYPASKRAIRVLDVRIRLVHKSYNLDH